MAGLCIGAELLGQSMIYTEDHAAGSDPGVRLLNNDNWRGHRQVVELSLSYPNRRIYPNIFSHVISSQIAKATDLVW